MRRRWLGVGGACVALGVLLLLLPGPIDPVAWNPPADAGFVGAFARNDRLAALDTLPLQGWTGPEDATEGPDGTVYLPTHEGAVLALGPGTDLPREVARPGGRVLGLQWDPVGDRLLLADAYRGLLEADVETGAVRVLADAADGVPIRYADHLDVDPQGRIWFSDASTKYGAQDHGGTWAASLLDVMEHGGHGRLLVHDPATGETRVALDGLQFANGVAVSHDGRAVLVVETGSYRVLRLPIEGGRPAVFIDNLPGFPDNLRRGREGRYWLGLISGRSVPLDALAPYPRLRALVQRLPDWMRPKEVPVGHVVALDDSGAVQVSLQDPAGAYPKTTGVLETADRLWVTSLSADRVGFLPASAVRGP